MAWSEEKRAEETRRRNWISVVVRDDGTIFKASAVIDIERVFFFVYNIEGRGNDVRVVRASVVGSPRLTPFFFFLLLTLLLLFLLKRETKKTIGYKAKPDRSKRKGQTRRS